MVDVIPNRLRLGGGFRYDQFSITARYVGIRYRFDDGAGNSTRVDGSHGGIGLNWYL
jgi:hypothetical protein